MMPVMGLHFSLQCGTFYN